MVSCPNCGEENREGILYCEHCAYELYGSHAHITIHRKVSDLGLKLPTELVTTSDDSDGDTVDLSDAGFSISIYIQDATEPIVLQPQERLILGRVDEAIGRRPDVDLVPYGALKKGVSRIHAAIDYNQTVNSLSLIDLGSSNGTFLNGQRLHTQERRVLSDGDEIRMGTLVAYCFFNLGA
jgi:hypothetical protein